MLGLALVVGVVAILLGGTILGLLSYRNTTNLMESKVSELQKVQDFKEAIKELDSPAVPRAKQIDLAAAKLADCRTQNQDTLDRGRTVNELDKRWTPGAIADLERLLGQLRQEISTEHARMDLGHGADTAPLPWQQDVKKLVDTTNDWEAKIYANFWDIKKDARASYTQSFWILGTTSVMSVLLMAGLLRFFYNWVFHPVRDLMEGVGRVSRGDFEHAIEVKSGDEMQELAAAFNDMTRRLRDIYRSLAHQVNERSRQLVRSERLASVGFLAAGVAHEINNPLASIAFCSEALEARLAETLTAGRGLMASGHADSGVIFKYLKMIQEEAFRCKEITQKLLEFSRSGERRREATDLGELIQSVLDITQHLQNHKGKRIVLQAPTKVTAWVNAQEVKSVVLNLVVNALDSMEEGGTLTIGLWPRDGMAELTFQDTGCGMTAEVLENIFEPFFTRSRTGKGTGLGLTISHRIVTGHGGEIEARSAGPEQGSTFTVRLPLQAPADEPAAGGKDEADVGDPELLFRRRAAA
jgi:signal transduction histidine kinase